MSNISKNSGTNVGIELSSIAVAGENGGRGECWKFNISNQFPIINPNIENGKVVLDVDSPHKGYSIQTVMENGKMSGESRILNEKNVKVASLVFVDGVANGPCKLYDNKGTIFFEGYFVNGYREGKGKEYDEKGNVVYEGFFEQGRRMNIVELKEMKGYWKEMNDANEVISICQKDDECRNDGICYFYSNGIIDRISEWKNGEEISDSGYCRIFDEPNKVFFEGYFEHGKREGKGIEVDLNGKVVFDGFYEHGNKLAIIPMKEMKGYWKEMNEKNEVISICKKNEKSENDGICYFYLNGKIDRISEWRDGEELNVLKRFEGKKMIEFVNGVKRYEGEYRDSMTDGYCREGEGEEYGNNGKSVVYHGCYWNGKRQGKGISYRNGDRMYDGMWIKGYHRSFFLSMHIVLEIAVITLSFFVHFILGCVLTACWLLFICWIVLRSCSSVRNDFDYQLQTCVPLKSRFAVRNKCSLHSNSFVLYSLYFESIVIGDDCFENIDVFKIDGLKRLKSLKIGNNSFTLLKDEVDNDELDELNRVLTNNPNRSFAMLNCDELESIEIGRYSFSDYGGGFELNNLPKLSTIKIGEIGRDSWNFFCSSFVIKGIIDMILLMNRSSTFEFH